MAKESLYLAADTLTFHCELIIATGNVLDLMKDTLLRTEDRYFDAECSSSSSALGDFKNMCAFCAMLTCRRVPNRFPN
ncbi:hypothetical protein CDAR_114551 [Caerostris darwini]|uniref:Uncharacterized protein n=1 Tax=Caerostris darwini TaxID=1538125 RepID=A0AAV4R3T1_9ARAC|nr:hypothetical protein CDAR_114551 [Caerostris darwini]